MGRFWPHKQREMSESLCVEEAISLAKEKIGRSGNGPAIKILGNPDVRDISTEGTNSTVVQFSTNQGIVQVEIQFYPCSKGCRQHNRWLAQEPVWHQP